VNAEELLQIQRALRKLLLEDRSTIKWKPARDLAAEMLLYLDDPDACWGVATRWLQVGFDADRVTGGRSDDLRRFYSPDFEAIRPSRGLPSIVGTRISISDPMVIKVFASDRTVVFRDVEEQKLFRPPAQETLLQLPSISIKLAVPVRDRGRRVAIVCAHWLDRSARVSPAVCMHLTELGATVLGPILAAADRLAEDECRGDGLAASVDPYAGSLEALLTPAELRLARLAATGMTYKEIARHLNRSFSTVDHHLRSIREKLGVSSAPKLVTQLSLRLRSQRH